jgi:hypothetical protein
MVRRKRIMEFETIIGQGGYERSEERQVAVRPASGKGFRQKKRCLIDNQVLALKTRLFFGAGQKQKTVQYSLNSMRMV